MVDLEESKRIAFETLSKIHLVAKLSVDEKKSLSFIPPYAISLYEVIAVQTEYLDENGVGKDILVYMVLKPDFPLSIPKIYIEQSLYDRIKYIPHIDTNRQVCTFDSDTSRTNPFEPGGIVKECLSRAIKIIETGVSQNNFNDFEAEFKAYWENTYSDQDSVNHDTLILIDQPPSIREISYINLEKNISNYENIIYQNDETGQRFLNYLEYRKIKYKKLSVCFLGKIELDFKPPFILDNNSIDKIISKLSAVQRSNFKKYINNSESPKSIFGFILVEGKIYFIGWKHQMFNTTRKGFRKNILNNYYAFKFLQKNDIVSRVSTQILTPKQENLRTAGIEQTNSEYKFAIIGLGSVGSNLMYFLNTLNNPEFRLIDYDQLSVENLNRHFLGLNYLGFNKTLALKNHYTLRNPFQIISFRNNSVVEVIKSDLQYLNDSDYLFCATGKANLEQWIGDSLNRLIKKPIFFLWVEPYMSAGHCLYQSLEGKDYKDFFDEDNFFKYNVIDKSEYISGNPLLSMREAGCQTSYIPYSLNNVTLFLSAIFPTIRKAIVDNLNYSMSMTWIGELKVIDDLGIKKSEFSQNYSSESLVIME